MIRTRVDPLKLHELHVMRIVKILERMTMSSVYDIVICKGQHIAIIICKSHHISMSSKDQDMAMPSVKVGILL